MKKLWMFRYWLVTLLGAVSLICLVAYHQHEISEQYRGHRATYCAAFSKTTVEEAACIEERESAKDYQKWWFALVSWPEGISTWAIIATGAFIAWQSWETRKSAEASGKQIELQRESLRPRIGLGNLVKDTFAEALSGEWVTVNIKLSNVGMPAYNVVIDTWIEFISGVPPYRFTDNARCRQAPPMTVTDGTGFFIPMHRRLTENERSEMANFNGAICFRVRIHYKAFNEDVHTDCACMLRPGAMEDIAEYTSAN